VRILFLGDVVGRSGREAVLKELPRVLEVLKPDATIINCENAAGGFGITEAVAGELFAAGADCLTGGNHSFDQKEALVFIAREPRLLRPMNYPAGTPGRGTLFVETAAGRLLVLNALGRLFMDPLDDPFASVERELGAAKLGTDADAILLDFHAEATSEKMAMAHFVDGRASALVGTHTHAPTADHQIFPGGTAYMSDAGMCGDYNSVIGMKIEEPIQRFSRKIAMGRMSPAEGPGTLCGVFVETGADGLARKIAPVRAGGRLEPTMPIA
jgi:metallophosphoesterase (TIGR00282 family)